MSRVHSFALASALMFFAADLDGQKKNSKSPQAAQEINATASVSVEEGVNTPPNGKPQAGFIVKVESDAGNENVGFRVECDSLTIKKGDKFVTSEGAQTSITAGFEKDVARRQSGQSGLSTIFHAGGPVKVKIPEIKGLAAAADTSAQNCAYLLE